MEWLTCLCNVLCWICQPVQEEAQSSLRGEARGLFSYLRGWVVDQINTRRSAFVEVPVDTASLVGADETVQEILNHLRDDEVRIIGICGMGGIGKTTLLRKINNHLFESKDSRGNFNVMIWVTVSSHVSIPNNRQNREHNSEENVIRDTVSREVSIPKIQKEIGDRLNLSFTDSESAVKKQAGILFQALSQKRFLLLLDDLWEKLDLNEVGIPWNHRDCKVAFTTRSFQVCTSMYEAKIVNVKPLDKTQSWELFCSKCNTPDALQNPSIQQLARQVADKCGGLPLALITVGRAMANRDHPGDWEHAINELDHPAQELQVLGEVIPSLKLSYDYLKKDNMRSALLYCAMYREDEDIDRKTLIDHWIGEGLLDVDGDIDAARKEGHFLISDLQRVCLLEAGIEDAYQYVRMHDAVRDMALWINNHDKVGIVDGFCVLDRDNSTQVTKMQSRGDLIRRIWVRDSELKGFPHDLGCSKTRTLRVTFEPYGCVVRHSLLQGFFNSMTTLRVLDLSGSELEKLPVEIGSLEELRYLNLSKTEIRSLPKELGGLKNLRQLELQGTSLVRVPRETIAGLSSLQVLNLIDSGCNWDARVEMKDSGRCEGSQQNSNLVDDAEGEGGRQLQLNDLEGLGRLQELGIQLTTPQSLKRVLSSYKLCRCTRRLCLKGRYNTKLHKKDGGALLRMFFDNTKLHKKDGAWFQMLSNKKGGLGSHLRELTLAHMDHPLEGELRFDLNELPCLELLSLNVVSGDPTTITIVGVTPSSKQNFKMLDIQNSHGWKQLKFVGIFPSLVQIKLWTCDNMEEVMLDDADGVGLLGSPFPMLREINLLSLPALKSIGRQPLLFPSLQTISLMMCPSLRSLPLGPSSAPKLRAIGCVQELWDAMKRGDNDGQNIKLILESIVRP